jgi:hypothetical protein
MKATQLLHEFGQSLWLDNITRDLLDSGTLKHYIDDLSVKGLTSNPTIFDHAIKNSAAYDKAILPTSSLRKHWVGSWHFTNIPFLRRASFGISTRLTNGELNSARCWPSA